MPRTKSSIRDERHQKLRLLIHGYAKSGEKKLDDISGILGICEKTASKYLRRPEQLPLEKLLKLARNLHIPIEDVRDSLRY